ncbi:MAG: molybdenum cofactor guanylyltransferase [Chloroflexi bacterium]|nr:molybdenum cofactor guanylyltransferase [Chloroflexota bacterium]
MLCSVVHWLWYNISQYLDWREVVSQALVSAVTGIVLAGGKSLRLGREKALEKLNAKSLLQWTIDSLSRVSGSILVVTSQEQFALLSHAQCGGKVIVDIYPGKAALGGMYTGLSSASTAYSVVVGCDMPFLNNDLLQYQIALAGGFDVVALRIDGKVEPLHAVYSKTCLPFMKRLVSGSTLAISQLFNMVKTRYVDEEEVKRYDPQCLSIFNVNTEEDLRRARALIKQIEMCT